MLVLLRKLTRFIFIIIIIALVVATANEISQNMIFLSKYVFQPHLPTLTMSIHPTDKLMPFSFPDIITFQLILVQHNCLHNIKPNQRVVADVAITLVPNNVLEVLLQLFQRQ